MQIILKHFDSFMAVITIWAISQLLHQTFKLPQFHLLNFTTNAENPPILTKKEKKRVSPPIVKCHVSIKEMNGFTRFHIALMLVVRKKVNTNSKSTSKQTKSSEKTS